MRFVSMVGVVVVCLFATSCGDEGFVDEPTGARQAAAAGAPGCHLVCPKCNPSTEACAKVMCYLDCNGKGPKCGPSRCELGEVCCNESCGICTPPDGVCTQQLCEPIQ